MNVEPQKFFIGLMDFFSILLSGALLTWLLMGEVGPVILGDRYAKLAGTEARAVFLFACYLFGHLVFLLGSWLDELYDWARCYTLNTQITQLAHRGRLLPWPARALIWLVFKRERDLDVDRAGKIKQQLLGAMQAKDAINTFHWSKAWLNAESPASLALVQRFEVDSKFFRSFALVLVLLLITWPWQPQWSLAGIPVVLALFLLALWCYMELPLKATNQAYWFVITLTAKDGNLTLDKIAPPEACPTHAGGVEYRLRGSTAEYLLVEATNDPTQWALPKGRVEEGVQHRETAVREVFEETGVWARIVHDMGAATWLVDGAVVKTHFYLMQAVGRGLRKDKDRGHVWLPLQQAIAKASHIETRELLLAA